MYDIHTSVSILLKKIKQQPFSQLSSALTMRAAICRSKFYYIILHSTLHNIGVRLFESQMSSNATANIFLDL